jgi:hypothetical protein
MIQKQTSTSGTLFATGPENCRRCAANVVVMTAIVALDPGDTAAARHRRQERSTRVRELVDQ